MKITGYDIDLEKIVDIINKKDYKYILLQIPEGLKNHVSKFIEFIETKSKSQVLVSGDPCFGACDIKNYDLKIDLIIHIGHTSIPNLRKNKIPILFVNALSDSDITRVVEKAIPSIHGKKIGIVLTAQHFHMIDKTKELLKNNNKIPVVGKGDKRIFSNGQILGCNFSAATSIQNDVDEYLFIGSGSFHPIGLILSTNKPVITCNPYTNEVQKQELQDIKDIILRQRYGAISRAKDAKIFGILVGEKVGQQRISLAYNLKKKIDKRNKKSIIFLVNHFSPAFLEGFRMIDCFVSTACPRIAIDDYMQYKIPIITPIELEILLGFKKWEDYQFDEITI